MTTSLSRALRSASALLENPDDLKHVFAVIDALSHPTHVRVRRRLRQTPAGRALLSERPNLAARLADRTALASLPEGSLGRAYLAFMEREGISADGIIAASAEGGRRAHGDAELDYVPERLRDTHDLWHAVTGYHGDLVGELCLLAFTFAQTGNPALLLILGGGMAKGFVRGRYGLVRDAYLQGRRASWLPGVLWEELLARPLDEVRARLHVTPVAPYAEVRSDELRAQGKLAAA